MPFSPRKQRCSEGLNHVTLSFFRLGIHDRTVQGPNEQRQEVAVDATHVFKHNSYNPRTYSHDIAMLKLPMNFQLNNHVNVIQLPGLNAGNVAAGTNCMVIGMNDETVTQLLGCIIKHLMTGPEGNS